jgi:hypothetical protein
MKHTSGVRSLFAFLAGVLLLAISGCVTPQGTYSERHQVDGLTIVFLDEKSLQNLYAAMSRKPPVILSASPSSFSVTSVRGFYDFATKTIYCSKLDFEVCGHELHHAILGRFHPDAP